MRTCDACQNAIGMGKNHITISGIGMKPEVYLTFDTWDCAFAWLDAHKEEILLTRVLRK